LDAPVGPDGAPRYAHQRGPQVRVAPEDACEVAIGVANGRIYLSATDRFGRLTSAPIAAAVEGMERRAQVNSAGGGAGLGMRRILEQSDLFAVGIVPGKACQATSVVDLGVSRRRAFNPKSLFFWSRRG
jgi:hypothetical protein